jgi:unsaturated rhamnogalacturonyl hydrolase
MHKKRYKMAWLIMLIMTSGCSLMYGNGSDPILFTVQRKTLTFPEKTSILLEWSGLSAKLDVKNGFTVTDRNFGNEVNAVLLDINADLRPDFLQLDFTFTSNEPIYTFSITPSAKKVRMIKGEKVSEEAFMITWLKPMNKKDATRPLPAMIIESTMKFYPDPAMISINAPGQWNYEYGFFLHGAFEYAQKTNNTQYLEYIKRWADRFIDERGNMDTTQYKKAEYRLDDILPGRLFISLYQATNDERYKNAARQLREHLRTQPKTSDGGYWHKQIYPYQMWLDGIYMGDIFSVQYAAAFNEPELFDEAIHQIKLIADHTRDPATGLFYHGWDESKNKVWAHPEKGTSPEFWGRAIGWYIMALVECLDYIPQDHPKRKDVIAILQDLAKNLVRYQDEKTGLWYQVIDKPNKPGNWIETSCSAMFAYAFAKGQRKGYLDASFTSIAKKAYKGLTDRYLYTDVENKLYLDQTVKVGTLNPKFSRGDFEYYVTTERRINDYKGLAALLYASIELDQ